jgi:translation initiation factor IF-1
MIQIDFSFYDAFISGKQRKIKISLNRFDCVIVILVEQILIFG